MNSQATNIIHKTRKKLMIILMGDEIDCACYVLHIFDMYLSGWVE